MRYRVITALAANAEDKLKIETANGWRVHSFLHSTAPSNKQESIYHFLLEREESEQPAKTTGVNQFI